MLHLLAQAIDNTYTALHGAYDAETRKSTTITTAAVDSAGQLPAFRSATFLGRCRCPCERQEPRTGQ